MFREELAAVGVMVRQSVNVHCSYTPPTCGRRGSLPGTLFRIGRAFVYLGSEVRWYRKDIVASLRTARGAVKEPHIEHRSLN